MFLLDVNILIAVLAPQHEHHDKAAGWFLANQRQGWATCPLTENGFIRIFGHSKYPDGPDDTEIAWQLLSSLCLQPGHQFWSDGISLLDQKKISNFNRLKVNVRRSLLITHKL
ncbi:hypothetical protein [Cerasicoccus arenae]|uniref:hypothetical protein n=1 Tax=Cerasicoccus arenae TaxID=424488 RepID=UPI00167B245C|nr:hypothetical protein [Cerasicoccus arenae]MBK1860012.1 hypothetical protein [Cerasicoccus arenae]